MTLLAAFMKIVRPWDSIFPQQRSSRRAIRQALGSLVCLGRRTLSRIIWTNGGEQRSWGAEYLLHSRCRWNPQLLFAPIVEAALPFCTGRYIGVAADDTRLHKAGTIMYAMGGTQHTTGVQIMRGYSILQMLLGNMGVPGGGINALRGENNVQGATDMAMLFHIVPGYMGIPNEAAHPALKDYMEKETPKTGWWSNKPKYFVSLLKAFWGDAAQPDNEFAYHYMPKVGKGYQGAGYSWMPLFESMAEGGVKGLMIWGMNPAVSSSNLNQTYAGLDKLDWLAAFDLWETDISLSFLETPRRQFQGH